MSKLSGMLYFDSRPLSAGDAASIEEALRSPGYMAARLSRSAGMLMGWAAGCEPSRAIGLASSPDGSCCSWDGRLDNRKDLLREERGDSSDSAVVLSLYQRKGVDGLKDVVGDWSLCIWDAARRAMVLASDFAGIRPLFYHGARGFLCWSSSLSDVVRWTGISELDETYVASFLVRGSAPERTPYAGIWSVPPGHAVCVSQERVEKRAFWSPPLHHEIRYRDERCYEEQLLGLFREASEARINADSPNCAELSGGLDSSSVVCMADRLQKETSSDRGLCTFSYTHDRCPDEKYFREVERHCNRSGTHLEIQDYPPIASDLAGDAAPAWWEPRFRELAKCMEAIGSGVFLTGQLGDLIMGNVTDDSDQVTDWLTEGRFLRAAQEAYEWGRSLQVPIYPILWTPPTSPHDGPGALPTSTKDSLVESLRARVRFADQEATRAAAWRTARPGRRRRLRALSEMLQARSLQAPEALQHVSYTHPFAHRPLVEFMLSIPAGVVCRPGQPRRLMRRAFAGLLPPLVLNRKSKAAYTTTYRGALAPLAAAMLQHTSGIQLVERGYVELASLTNRLEKFTQGLECNESQLRPMILFEFWLRSRGREGARSQESVATMAG
jgi:asparagine synthase (glutamine-hydrolysing)